MILRYETSKGKQTSTFVVWKCEICKLESTSRLDSVGAFKNKNLDICRMCARLGPPRTVKQAQGKYPQVLEVRTFDKRGGVHSGSIILARCSNCRQQIETEFRHVVELARRGKNWRCVSCARQDQFGKSFISPETLPSNILECDLGTLGRNGTVRAHTRVRISCPECLEERWTEWDYYKNGSGKCHSCVSREQARANHIRVGSSKLHIEIKRRLLEANLLGFQSEVIVGGVAVDEVDVDRKLALEINGNYWHANPKLYGPDRLITRTRGRAVTASQIWERDKIRISRIKSEGYKVYVLWEKEFKDNPESEIKKLGNWIKKTRR